jgi:hypothetical protein
MRSLAGYVLFCVVGITEGRSQQSDQALSRSSELASLTAEEARRGIYVFYTQSFVDEENKRASYRGSVYGAIQKFGLNGCELEIQAMIVDKFAGTVGNRPTGELQDTYRYSATVMLSPEIAGALTLIEARPAQLGPNTHSVCEQDSSCSFQWLRIEAKQKSIRETSTVNDSPSFNGQVTRFVVPISSAEMGKRLIDVLRTIAGSRCP